MTYGSICSGIEAATVAWQPLGWKAAWFAEIEKFPSAVLAHHYPDVPNYGDFTKTTRESSEPIDLLVGGTPCQSFSFAGKRLGLDDPRGNLTIEWLRLVQRLTPRWLVWENVPGVLSDDGGRTFGTILGTLAELGYGFAYRVLDAFGFHLPAPRKRVFLVANLGRWRTPAAVLVEPGGISRDIPKRSPAMPTITTRSAGSYDDTMACVDEGGWIRKITPVETERALGFPDDYTLVPYRGKMAADSPRYKAIGNSMAVPVMRWIGERIEFVDQLEVAA